MQLLNFPGSHFQAYRLQGVDWKQDVWIYMTGNDDMMRQPDHDEMTGSRENKESSTYHLPCL